MAREYIESEDLLNTGRKKLNRSIDKSYDAEETSVKALEDANKLGNEAKQISTEKGNESIAIAKENEKVAGEANLIAKDTNDRMNQIIGGETDSAEIIDSRKPLGLEAASTLNERLNMQFGNNEDFRPEEVSLVKKMKTEFLERGKNVKWFGAKGDGVTDDTDAINLAIQSCSDYDQLSFPSGIYLVNSEIVIDRNIHIIGFNAKIIHTRTEYLINLNSIFFVDKPLDFVKIEGFECDTIAFGSNLRISFFANGYYDKSIENSVKNLEISNNRIKHLLVSIYGKETAPRIENNKWITDDEKKSNRSYLNIDKGIMINSESKSKIGGWITGNIFDVYPADSNNFDLIKISGATKALNISNNYIINRNTNCAAQVDVYTGGDALKFTGNHLYNVSVVRKEFGTAVTEDLEGTINLDIFSNNYFEFTPDFTLNVSSVIEVRGSFFSLINNQFKVKNSQKNEDFYLINIRVEDGIYNGGLETDRPYAYIISGNQADIRGSLNGVFYRTDGSTDSGGVSSIVGNLVVGGKRFSSGTQDKGAAVGNAWSKVTNPEGVSFFNMRNGVAIGNVSGGDLGTILTNESENSNMAKRVQKIHDTRTDGSSIDNTISGRVIVRGGGNITSAMSIGEGKRLILIGLNESATIVHSNAIRLKGAVNATIPLRGFLELEYLVDCWVEVSRSF